MSENEQVDYHYAHVRVQKHATLCHVPPEEVEDQRRHEVLEELANVGRYPVVAQSKPIHLHHRDRLALLILHDVRHEKRQDNPECERVQRHVGKPHQALEPLIALI